jgi:hypothetical protein
MDFMPKQKNRYDFNDFSSAISSANRAVKVIEMKDTDFQQWKSGAVTTRKADRPLIGSLHQVKFVKGSRLMHYKLNPDSTELTYDFLSKRFKFQEPEFRQGQRGVSEAKKRDIISKLCPLMPANRRFFWESLSVSNVPDLIDSENE